MRYLNSRSIRAAALLLLGAFFLACPADSATNTGAKARVQLAVDRLQQWYQPGTGLWDSTGWWNAANALTAVIDYSSAVHTTQYRDVIAQSFAQTKHPGFLNEFYDDEGWWALAWIDAYDLTGNAKYLQTAESIFDDMTGGWSDDTCGGGLWWKKDHHYKNAIANELFLDVAAHLANRATDSASRAKYLNWATREWGWFEHSTMITADGEINDGLDSKCENNHRTVWSYNQGVILAGLAELSQQPGQSGVLSAAERIAGAALEHLTDAYGVLHDPCEPKCGADGTQFKGIFVRNLAILNKRKPAGQYVRFIQTNADSLLNKAENADGSFGAVWTGPPGPADASTQSSALDALTAAIAVRAKGYR